MCAISSSKSSRPLSHLLMSSCRSHAIFSKLWGIQLLLSEISLGLHVHLRVNHHNHHFRLLLSADNFDIRNLIHMSQQYWTTCNEKYTKHKQKYRGEFRSFKSAVLTLVKQADLADDCRI